jgi:hypothetical protein
VAPEKEYISGSRCSIRTPCGAEGFKEAASNSILAAFCPKAKPAATARIALALEPLRNYFPLDPV